MASSLKHKFSDLVSQKKNLELSISICEKPPHDVNIYDPARADFFSIMIVVNGEANIKVNLENKKLVKNSMLLIAPNTIMQLINKTEDAEVYRMIFTSGFLLQLGIQKHEIEMIDFIITSNDRVVNLDEDEASPLLRIIEDLKQKNDKSATHPYGEDIVKHSFRIFLYEMAAIGLKYNVTKNRTSRKQDLVMRFGTLVNEYFKEHRSVKFYADQLAITPKYLTEIVHEITGRPASEFIDEVVMNEAKFLLNNPRITISQIADSLHFSDQSFLGKFFKRHSGLSPSEYRHKI